MLVRDVDRARPPARRRDPCRRACGGGRRCLSSSCSWPIGSCTATQRSESWLRSASSVARRSRRARGRACSRRATRERPERLGALPERASSAPRRPSTPLTTTSAPSTTRRRGERVRLEARIARRVDEVDLAAPATRRGRRDAASDICRRCSSSSQSETVEPCLDGAEAVGRAGLEEHRLDERGLARPAVADDGDVADLARLELRHGLASLATCPQRAGRMAGHGRRSTLRDVGRRRRDRRDLPRRAGRRHAVPAQAAHGRRGSRVDPGRRPSAERSDRCRGRRSSGRLRSPEGGVLDQLYVHPDLQRRGIGDALFARVKELRPDGFRLWVFQRTTQARRFYERRGLCLVELTDGTGTRSASRTRSTSGGPSPWWRGRAWPRGGP